MNKPIIIATDGKMTMVYSDGKVYGDHISAIEFSHKAGNKPVINITADEIPIEPMRTDVEQFKGYFEMLIGNKR